MAFSAALHILTNDISLKAWHFDTCPWFVSQNVDSEADMSVAVQQQNLLLKVVLSVKTLVEKQRETRR